MSENELEVFQNENPYSLQPNTHSITTIFLFQAIGPVPKWCAFLENLTEEMEEEKANVVYDDYKFVTRQELEALNLARHIGTKKLRAYMHGYFVNVQLYLKAKQNSEPFAYEEFKEKKIREKIDKLRHDRVKLDVSILHKSRTAEVSAARKAQKYPWGIFKKMAFLTETLVQHFMLHPFSIIVFFSSSGEYGWWLIF